MTNSHSEINELKTLQVEAEGLKDKRKGFSSGNTSEASQQSQAADREDGQQLPQDETIEEQSSGTNKVVQDLADQIENVLKDMEDAATERPALALLSAFALGIIVGQLFSRR
jgi:FtsZ-binding cell division protein ZapB